MSLDLTDDCNYWIQWFNSQKITDYDSIYGTEVNPFGMNGYQIMEAQIFHIWMNKFDFRHQSNLIRKFCYLSMIPPN